MSTQPTPTPSALGQAVSQPDNFTPSTPEQDFQDSQAPQAGGSRLLAILGAVAKVGTTALAGIGAGNRPSFLGGMTQGARASQAADAAQQAIKFRSFDDSLRAAQMHNDDLRLQNQTEAQQNANQKEWEERHDWLSDHGYDDTTIANHGDAATNQLATQTTINGSAAVPSGSGVNPDLNTIHIPTDTQKTRDAQKQQYDTFAPAYGLPSRNQQQDFVPGKNIDLLDHAMRGLNPDGSPVLHDKLPAALANMQTQRAAIAAGKNVSPAVLNQIDNTIGIMKSNLKALDDHAAGVKQQSKQAEIDAENSPQSVAGAASKAATTEQAKLNVTNSPVNQDAAATGAAKKSAAEEQAKGNENLVVAFNPTYQNSDGTKGGNVVLTKGDAQAQGLQHYKVDGGKISSTIGSFNDVQGKVNQLAAIATDPNRMGQVDPGNAAAILAHDHGLDLGAGAAGLHAGVDTSRFNEKVYAAAVSSANQATLDYVTAMVNAHEAITQLPRLQTFGQSSRMTQQQMEAAVNLLPHPGDGRMAQQKMVALQGQLDSLRKAMPHMQGAELNPTWLEKQPQQQAPQQAAPIKSFGSKLADFVTGN